MVRKLLRNLLIHKSQKKKNKGISDSKLIPLMESVRGIFLLNPYPYQNQYIQLPTSALHEEDDRPL